jgi:hypothetical protein
MPTKKQTISVRRAARLLKQSSGAFLEKAGEGQARQVLIAWALHRHRQGEASFSELAAETGLAVEELMLAAGQENPLDALETFLSSCRTLAEASGDREFLRASEEAVNVVKHQLSGSSKPASDG